MMRWGIPCKLGKLDTDQHPISLRWYVSEFKAWIINNTLWYSTGTGGTTPYHRIPTSIPFRWGDMWVRARPGSSTTHCDTVQEQKGPQHITGYRPASHFIEMICEWVQGLDHQQHTVIQYRNRRDHNMSQDTDQHPISLRWYVSECKAWIINNTLWYSTGTGGTTTYHRIPTSIPFHWDDMWVSARPGSSTTHCDTVQEQEGPQHITGYRPASHFIEMICERVEGLDHQQHTVIQYRNRRDHSISQDTDQHPISLRWYVSELKAWIINNTLWYSTGTGGTTAYHRIPTSIPFHWDDMWVSSRPGSSTTHCDTVQEQEGPQHITGYRPASHFIEMICEWVQGLDHQQHTVIQYRNRRDHNISQDTDQHPISLRWYVSECKAWIINNTLWYSTGTGGTTTYHRIPTSIPFHWDDMWASARPGSSTTHCDTVQEQEGPQHITGYRPASHFIEMICERVQGLDHQQHTVIQYRNRRDHNISQDTECCCYFCHCTPNIRSMAHLPEVDVRSDLSVENVNDFQCLIIMYWTVQ